MVASCHIIYMMILLFFFWWTRLASSFSVFTRSFSRVFFFSNICFHSFYHTSTIHTNYNSRPSYIHSRKHEKVDIFSTFIFVNVVTRLMKHINFVAAMTRDFLLLLFVSSMFHRSHIQFFGRLMKYVVIIYLYILQY